MSFVLDVYNSVQNGQPVGQSNQPQGGDTAQPAKTPYQQNMAQPTQTDKWYSGSMPTSREIYGRIWQIGQSDPQTAMTIADGFMKAQADPSSPWYAPYKQPTNDAVATMASYGVDVSHIDDQWFADNSWMMQYEPSNAKKASKEQKMSYAFNQIANAYDNDKAVKNEFAALQDEINYLANWKERNYSDQQIKDMIYGSDGSAFAKKYPTLAKMDASMGIGGSLVKLNSGSDYSKDNVDTMIWRARNGGGSGNMDIDTVYSVSGEGNHYIEDPAISAKTNWNDSDNYSPFSTGMTLVEEGIYFDTYEFTPEKIEELRATLDPSDATAMSMFDNVVAAEETTVKAETERANLMAKVDGWIGKGYSYDKIMEKADGYLDKNCPTLRAMDKSMKSSDQKLLPTTRAIDYKHEDLSRYVDSKTNAPRTSGAEETVEVLSHAGEMMKMEFSPQEIETDKTETAVLKDAVASVEEQMTPAELAYMNNAGSSLWDRAKAVWGLWNQSIVSGKGISKEFALAQMEKADNAYTTASMESLGVIKDYDQVKEQFDSLSATYADLYASFGDLEYYGKEVNENPVIDITVNGSPTQIRLKRDPETGRFVYDAPVTSNPQYFRTHIENQEDFMPSVERAAETYNNYADTIVRVNSEGHRMTKEGQEGLQQLYEVRAKMEDAQAYLAEHQDAYDKAWKTEQDAKREYMRTYKLLNNLGVATDGGQQHLFIIDEAQKFSTPQVHNDKAYSDINILETMPMATMQDGKVVYSDDYLSPAEVAKYVEDAKTESEERVKDIEFEMEYLGDTIPESYRKNMEFEIGWEKWRQAEYDYYLMGNAENFDEMVEAGKQKDNDELHVDVSLYWDDMTQEEKNRYYFLFGRDGYEAARDYYDHLTDMDYGTLHKRKTENLEKATQSIVEDSWIGANILSVAATPAEAITNILGLGYKMFTGKDVGDTAFGWLNTVANTTNSETTAMIQEAYKNDPVKREVLGGIYEIAWNRGRSMMNGLAFGGLGSGSEVVGAFPMAATAMFDKISELEGKNIEPWKVWVVGAATFLSESCTEAIELGNIKSAKELGSSVLGSLKQFAKQYPQSGLSEMIGESLNDLIENAADEIVLGDQGEHADRVWYYRTTMGVDKETAEQMAYKDEAYAVLHTALISFLSPGADVLSYASGKAALYDHYRRQGKELGLSIRDIRNGERTRVQYAQQEAEIGERIENAPTLEYESQTREAILDRYQQNEADIDERVNSVPTLELDRAESEVNNVKENNDSYMVDMEILETASQTSDNNTKSASLAAVLTSGETDADNDIAKAAAVNVDNAFGDGVNDVLDLMEGGAMAGVDPATLKKGIQYAALGGEEGACSQVVHSEAYQNAMPDERAVMLADAVNADEHNQKVQENVASAVRESQVAEREADLIRNGAMENVNRANETLKTAEAAVRQAETDLEARQGEVEAASQALTTAVDAQNNDPSDNNYKAVVAAIAELGKRNESLKQYEQHLEKMRANAEKARNALEQIKQTSLAAVRKQAEAAVNQSNQERAVATQQRNEAMQKAAEVAAQAQKDAREFSNFSRLDAEEQIDRLYPNISGPDRARAIMTYMAVQKQMSNTVPKIQARQEFTNKLAKKYNLTVKNAPANSRFNAKIDPKTRTLYVNEKTTQSDIMYAILLHEITHPAEGAKDIYNDLANTVLGIRYGEGVTFNGVLEAMNRGDLSSKIAQDVLSRKRVYDTILAKQRGQHSYEEILQELVADGVGYVIASDSKALERIAAEKPNVLRRIVASIKNFMRKMAGLDDEVLTQAQQVADKLNAALDKVWGGEQKNSISAQPLVEDADGNELATELPGGTVSVDRYSLNSFNADEQKRVRQALIDSGRFTKDEVDQYLDDALSIASMIAADRTRLDFEANDNQVFLKKNSDYYFTLDASTLCAKRLLYQGTFDYVQHALPDEVFTPEDLIDLVNIMNDMGFETPCGICYVESRRRWLDTYAQKFLDKLAENPDALVDKYFKKSSEEEKAAIRERLAGDPPSIDDLTTSDGLEKLRHDDPYMHKVFVADMNAKGTANPKVVQLRTEYRGDIGKMTANDVQKVKDIGGLRIQSFSDFETPHLLDMMQAVMDMASRKLTSQAYTKVPNFAWVFGDTGIKINLSLIGKGTGLDENGNLVFDNREGMNFDEAMKLRERYGSNVGTILVGINDDHIIAAMGDPRIDFIIPFHKSGWSEEELRKMPTLNNYEDYTATQNELVILGQNEDGSYETESFKKHKERTKESLENFQPVGKNGYWDFDKSGQWNAENYLKMCADQHRVPKFSQFLVDNGDGSFSLPQGDDKRSTSIREGYWKTLIDFKMYENDSYGRTMEDGAKTEVKGARQQEVTPNVNMAEAYRVMNDYQLGRQMPDQPDGTKGRFIPMENNNSVPVAVPAAEEYIELIRRKRGWTKPTGPNPDTLEADLPVNPKASAFGASQAPAVLGNTEGEATEASAAQQNAMAIDAETGETVRDRFSLPTVSPVVSSDESVWTPGHTEAWFRENGFPIYQDVPLDQQEINRDTSKKGHGTQIASTESTYRKLFDRMEKENPNGWQNMRVLDASSGLGLGTQAGREMGFNVTDIEPFPNSTYNPDYTDYSDLQQRVESGEVEPFDYIISNAVLNVIPQDTRDNLVAAMGSLLKPGGKLFVNVISKDYEGARKSNPNLDESRTTRKGTARTMEGDYSKSGNAAGRGHETFVWGSNSVQKVFSTPELIGYLKDALGDGYTVKRDSIGMTGVLVTKDSGTENSNIRYSLPSDAPYLSAVNHGDMEEAQRLVDEKAMETFPNSVLIQNGKFRKMWHHTNQEFTEFLPGSSPDLGGIKGIFFTPNEYGAISSAGRDIHKQYYLNVENLKFSYGVKKDEQFADELHRRQEGVTDREEIARINKEFSDETGIDAFFDWQNGWYTMLNPENIKSADPVTYDDNGNVIPLSERFRTGNPDIRYSLPSDDILEQDLRYAIENGSQENKTAKDVVESIGWEVKKERDWNGDWWEDRDNIYDENGRLIGYTYGDTISFGQDIRKDSDIANKLANAGFKIQSSGYYATLPQQEQTNQTSNISNVPNVPNVPNGITTNINPESGTRDRQWGREGLQESDEIAEQAKKYILAHNKYYPDTNSEQIDRAIEWIRSQKAPRDPDGYNAAFQKVTSPNFNYRSADGQARMIAMMGMAVARNDVPAQVQLADAYNKQGTVLGQALQARKLWKMMTPEGRIGSLQKMLANAQAELARRGINTELTFSQWVYAAATAATEDGDMQRVYQMAGRELADQMPSNWRDKIRSIRMLAMLGNPRTHIRNIIGNALFVPAVGLKNKLGAVMELGKKPGERTKTTALFLNKEARAFAREDALRMKDELRGEAKYNELNSYQKEQKAFKGLLQAVIDFNSDMLENEDWKFLRGHYVRALGGWMMANNYTAEQLKNDPILLEQGRSYAILEAQKATYRDFSKMASTLNKVSREGGVAGFVVDAVLPFKKTPANILKRGVEYSPVGIMRSLTTDLYHLKQWNDAQAGKLAGIPEKAISPTQFIDRLCSGLSGSAIMGIGFLLSSMGLVTCGLNDDDDKLEKEQGAQQYSIKILGTDVTYTMDWAAPISMPFFVGAAVREQFSEQDGFNVEDIMDALGNISEPVFNLSMLDGVNTLFKTSQNDDTNTITQIGAKIGSNYVTSYVPSILGAIARTIDGNRRKAYVKSGEGTGVLGTLRYAWEQTENKLPGVSTSNIPYRDVWGNEETSGLAERLFENFISPGYINNYKNDPILNEMGRLYDVTHDKAMIPGDPAKSFKFNGENHVLTAEEWDRYKVARGQAAFNGLTELIGTQEYNAAEDDVKAEMIKEVWSYADKIGKNAAVPSYMVESKGENPIAEITKSSTVKGYEGRMLQALELGDFDTYETMVEALHQEEVEDSAIKTKIGTAYRDKYKTAYINDDFATMAEIEEILDNTDFDFDLDAWEERADEKYGR